MSQLSDRDLERILEIWEEAVRATHDFLAEDDISFFRPMVRDACMSGCEVILARDGLGQVQGFMGLSFNESGQPPEARSSGTTGQTCKIEMLFVHPACHGQGLGRTLVGHARKRSADLLVDVNEQNTGARLFYEACGFQVIGRSALDDTGKPYPLLHMKLASGL